MSARTLAGLLVLTTGLASGGMFPAASALADEPARHRIVPIRRHPVDEHITVVQGTLFFGVGDKFERAAVQKLETGG